MNKEETERIIKIRTSYTTDADYKKGMYVALLDGKIVSRHYDLGKLGSKLNKIYPDLRHVLTKSDMTLAGY